MSAVIAIRIWSTTLFHEAVPLVVFLALLAPLRRLVLSILFVFVTFFLRLVYSLWIVLCRAVDRHELERS